MPYRHTFLLYICKRRKVFLWILSLSPSMLRAILNKSWRQHTTRHQLYGHLPPITNTIQVR